eukprot:6201859-Pleurochrysis_carterae.AAC.1
MSTFRDFAQENDLQRDSPQVEAVSSSNADADSERITASNALPSSEGGRRRSQAARSSRSSLIIDEESHEDVEEPVEGSDSSSTSESRARARAKRKRTTSNPAGNVSQHAARRR